MKALSANEIRGNWVTLLLPIDKNGAIDFILLNDTLDKIISVRPDGIYSNGTAGEFYNISESEFDKISEILALKCNEADVPFQIGVSHMSPVLSLERLKRTIHLRPSAVQVILPDWFVPTEIEIINFLQRMAFTAGEIGLVLYNPPHAKRNLLPSEILKFKKEIPQLVGIKVADGNEKWYEEIEEVTKHLSVFIPGHKIATGHERGICHGAYSNMACMNPKAAQIWNDQIITDIKGALALERRIALFLDQNIVPLIKVQKYSNQAIDKLLAAIGGWTGMSTLLRWPYRSVPSEMAESLRPIAKKILPEFFIKF